MLSRDDNLWILSLECPGGAPAGTEPSTKEETIIRAWQQFKRYCKTAIYDDATQILFTGLNNSYTEVVHSIAQVNDEEHPKLSNEVQVLIRVLMRDGELRKFYSRFVDEYMDSSDQVEHWVATAMDAGYTYYEQIWEFGWYRNMPPEDSGEVDCLTGVCAVVHGS